MENQIWKIGDHQSTVVSDTKVKNTNFPSPPNPEESRDDEVKYYGGYLICESIGNYKIAKLISAAPDLLNAIQILLGDIERYPVRLTREEKIKIARKAIEKAKG